MDQAMHNHWLVAERRIDVALGALAACGSWILLLPLFVLLSDTRWTPQFSLAIVAAAPIVLVFAGLLGSALRVARAIEERDQDELVRWRTTLVAPEQPDLLTVRLRRIHYPMLGIIGAAMAGLVVMATVRLGSLSYPEEAGYVRGIALVALGIGLAVGVLMLPVSARAQLKLIVAVSWLVPVGGGLCSYALVLHSDAIAAAVSSPSITSFVYVILGILILLIAVTALCFWVAWLGRAYSGRSLLTNDDAREVPEISSQHGVADPEFDEVDAEIVAGALVIDGWQRGLAVVIVCATVGIVVLSVLGHAGSPFHGFVAAVLSIASVTFLYRLRGAGRAA